MWRRHAALLGARGPSRLRLPGLRRADGGSARRRDWPTTSSSSRLGDTVRCGRFSLTVLWPERLADDGGNADSLCLLAFWDGDGDGAAEWTALFTGDAEAEQLGQLSDRLPSRRCGRAESGAPRLEKEPRCLFGRAALARCGAHRRRGGTTATGIRPGRCSTCWTRIGMRHLLQRRGGRCGRGVFRRYAHGFRAKAGVVR